MNKQTLWAGNGWRIVCEPMATGGYWLRLERWNRWVEMYVIVHYSHAPQNELSTQVAKLKRTTAIEMAKETLDVA